MQHIPTNKNNVGIILLGNGCGWDNETIIMKECDLRPSEAQLYAELCAKGAT